MMFSLLARYRAAITMITIFLSCWLIARFAHVASDTNILSWAVLGDLLITAPVFYLILLPKNKRSVYVLLRVLMVSLLIAPFILRSSTLPVLPWLRRWMAPVVEMALIGLVVSRLYRQFVSVKAEAACQRDFLWQAREVLKNIIGNGAAARVMAAEIAVFYYVLRIHEKEGANEKRFSTYRSNGSRLVISCFLFLFMVETVGMHFLLRIWSPNVALAFTLLGGYSCLQLLAHIRSLPNRGIVLGSDNIFFRNGLLGGEALVALDDIDHVELLGRSRNPGPGVPLAFIKGLEKPNVLIVLHRPTMITKAFGRQETSDKLLLSVDQPAVFLQSVEERRASFQ